MHHLSHSPEIVSCMPVMRVDEEDWKEDRDSKEEREVRLKQRAKPTPGANLGRRGQQWSSDDDCGGSHVHACFY